MLVYRVHAEHSQSGSENRFVKKYFVRQPIVLEETCIQIPGCDYGRILAPLRRVRPLVPVGEDALEGQGRRRRGGGGGGGGREPDTIQHSGNACEMVKWQGKKMKRSN